MQTVRSFVGMDVHKETIPISVAEDGRNAPMRFIGVLRNPSQATSRRWPIGLSGMASSPSPMWPTRVATTSIASSRARAQLHAIAMIAN